jgi:hypothetical protein
MIIRLLMWLIRRQTKAAGVHLIAKWDDFGCMWALALEWKGFTPLTVARAGSPLGALFGAMGWINQPVQGPKKHKQVTPTCPVVPEPAQTEHENRGGQRISRAAAV